jgi:hypothetical protein
LFGVDKSGDEAAAHEARSAETCERSRFLIGRGLFSCFDKEIRFARRHGRMIGTTVTARPTPAAGSSEMSPKTSLAQRAAKSARSAAKASPRVASKTAKKAEPITRANSHRNQLYIWSVQCPEAEIDFVSSTFKKIAGRPLRFVREDFCGSAATSVYFVQQHKDNRAVGVDLHKPTLDWGLKHVAKELTAEQRSRLTLLNKNVLDPGAQSHGADAVLAMNFSYWIFQEREQMRSYFAGVRKSLAKDGVLFMDIHGGYETTKEQEEPRWIRVPGKGKFRYIWDQHRFNPLTSEVQNYIHFEFEKGPALRKAFSYTWRVWTVREIRELLLEAGFKHVHVYCEGEDKKGKGNGVYTSRTVYDADASFIAYISAHG